MDKKTTRGRSLYSRFDFLSDEADRPLVLPTIGREANAHWLIAAATTFHPGAELVDRHGAEHWYLLAERIERYPDRSLAAFASDRRITLGLLRVSAIRASKPRLRRVGKSSYGLGWEQGALVGVLEKVLPLLLRHLHALSSWIDLWRISTRPLPLSQ